MHIDELMRPSRAQSCPHLIFNLHNHYLHTASKRIVDFLVKEGAGTVIIGKNPLWKQETGMGKRNNQKFGAPHQRRK